jgi:type 2 lantibiotic biosynthesis protein LanM
MHETFLNSAELPWFASPFRAEFGEAAADLLRDLRSLELPPRLVNLDSALETALLAPLFHRLHQISHRTLALEINVARLLGQLEGNSPEERFRFYVKKMENPEARAQLFSEYPLLLEDACEALRQWRLNTFEFFLRLQNDHSELEKRFGELGSFKGFDNLSGDSHQGGRQVRIARFASGCRLVYKPHSVAVDAHFQELLSWLERSGLSAPPRTIQVLPRSEYGWVEFVSPGPCSSEAELTLFYRRLGTLLAAFHVLNGNDLHFENVVACGAHPVVIDLETLFHPEVTKAPDFGKAGDFATDAFARSVLTSGLIPKPVGAWGGRDLDVSGIAAYAEQLGSFKSSGLLQAGTDEIHIGETRWDPGLLHNRPRLALPGAEPSMPPIQADPFVEGFIEAYRLLLQLREQALEEGGFLNRCSADTVRLVLRPTRLYGQFRSALWHPDFLHSSEERKSLLEKLQPGPYAPHLEKFVASERAQLAIGDIPYFHLEAASREVAGGDGARVPEGVRKSGIEAAKERWLSLSEADLARQLWFIRASFSTLADQTQIKRGTLLARRQIPGADADGLSLARAAGDLLQQLALREKGEAHWVNILSRKGESPDSMIYSLDLAELGLYSGAAGITFFLAQLAQGTGEQRFRLLAEEALAGILSRLGQEKPALSSGFYGWSSLIYLFSHLGDLWKRPDLLDRAENLLPRAAESIGSDSLFDIISGNSGTLLALLSLHQLRPRSGALEIARKCGDHLLEKAVEESAGLNWPGLPVSRGFSHGLAGVAYALEKLAAACGPETGRVYRRAADQAASRERALIGRGEWTSGRIQNGRHQSAWCHGAPGIAMGRLGMLAVHSTRELEQDAREALTELIGHFPTFSHAPCHGSLGNLEALALAVERFPEDPSYRRALEHCYSRAMEDISAHGWASTLPSQTESIGLMVGLAGVGYQALRISSFLRGKRLPSVLVLEEPKNC